MEKPDAGHQQSASGAEPRGNGAADRKTSEAARKHWDAALDNPEARAFLKRAMERRERMEREGLIHRP